MGEIYNILILYLCVDAIIQLRNMLAFERVCANFCLEFQSQVVFNHSHAVQVLSDFFRIFTLAEV